MTYRTEHSRTDGQGSLVHNLPEGRSDCPHCGWSGVPTRANGQIVHLCPACESPTGEMYEFMVRRRRREAAERATVRHQLPKVGRNDACPCESGRKFKRCCGVAP